MGQMSVKTAISILFIAVAFAYAQQSLAQQAVASGETLAIDESPGFVQPEGSFIASQCGDVSVPSALQTGGHPELLSVTKVCAGKIQGLQTDAFIQAFSLQLSDNSTVIYRVINVTNYFIKLLSGAVKSNVFLTGPTGEQVSLTVFHFKNGILKNLSGQIGPISIYVPEMGPVATLRSASL